MDKMKEEHGQLSIFDSSPNSQLYNYRMSVDQLQDQLAKFGLTGNQSKVYIYLGKYGSKSAPEVCRALKLPRTETYHLLTALQNKGIVSATFQHPIKFKAIKIDKAVWILVNAEKERIKGLEKQEQDIHELWDKIPEFHNQKLKIKKINSKCCKELTRFNQRLLKWLIILKKHSWYLVLKKIS